MSWNCVLAWTAAANPNRLRVRVHCRWRVTPSHVLGLSSLGTRKFGIRAVESFLPFSKLPRKWVQHERSAPVGTPHHRLVSNAQTNLRASGPNVLPRITFSGVFGFRVFLNLGLSFSLYFLLCVLYLFVPFCIFCCARLCICDWFFFVCARASVLKCISGCILKRKSGPPRESLRRHPDCSVQTCTQKVTSKPRLTKEGPSPRKETQWTSLSLLRVGPARPCAQVGKGHPSVRKVDTPCCPCTLQKGFRHDKPVTSSL